MKELTQEEYKKVRDFLYDLQKKDAKFTWFLENFLIEANYNCIWYYMEILMVIIIFQIGRLRKFRKHK